MGSSAVATNAYDAYGVPAPTNGTRFQYTGQIVLPGLAGLYHYKARIYNPALGRFMQTDPVGYKDDLDLYAYVGNDPLNHNDPTGAIIDTIADIGFIAYDLYQIATGGATATNVAALAADVVGAVAPGITGLGASIRAVKSVEQTAVRESAEATTSGLLTRVPTGHGSVPKAERDPQRFFTPAEREAKRSEQGYVCANGCEKKIDNSNSEGHHIKRHADGGRTISENHAEVCLDCHAKIHSRKPRE